MKTSLFFIFYNLNHHSCPWQTEQNWFYSVHFSLLIYRYIYYSVTVHASRNCTASLHNTATFSSVFELSSKMMSSGWFLGSWICNISTLIDLFNCQNQWNHGCWLTLGRFVYITGQTTDSDENVLILIELVYNIESY